MREVERERESDREIAGKGGVRKIGLFKKKFFYSKSNILRTKFGRDQKKVHKIQIKYVSTLRTQKYLIVPSDKRFSSVFSDMKTL